jgi:DNA-binding transcriptional ArsR family regulator
MRHTEMPPTIPGIEMPGAEPLDEAAAVAVFSALVEPTRRSLLDALARQGPATVSELADRLPVTRQAVAKHLAQLVDAGLVVAGEPQGRRVPYHLRSQPMRAALAWLRALANQWDDRLDALTDHLDAVPQITRTRRRQP